MFPSNPTSQMTHKACVTTTYTYTISYDSIDGIVLVPKDAEMHRGGIFLEYPSWEYRPMMLHVVCRSAITFIFVYLRLYQQVGKDDANYRVVTFWASK